MKNNLLWIALLVVIMLGHFFSPLDIDREWYITWLIMSLIGLEISK